MELYTGDALFQTHENMEHLALMERSLGPFPADMLSQAQLRSIWGPFLVAAAVEFCEAA